MRLIDADKLNFTYVQEVGFEGQMHCVVRSLEIKDAPTVDAVPVVRCKDCKFAREPQRDCREEADACEGILVCWNGADTVFADEIGWRFVNDDFFCGDGKRKDGDLDAQ